MQVSNQEIVHPLYTMNSISFVGYYKHLEGWGIYEEYKILYQPIQPIILILHGNSGGIKKILTDLKHV